MRVNLSKEEVEAVLEDCLSALGSCHYPGLGCDDLTNCLPAHFDEEAGEIRRRQQMVRKMEKKLAEVRCPFCGGIDEVSYAPEHSQWMRRDIYACDNCDGRTFEPEYE